MEQHIVQPSSISDDVSFGEWFLTIFLTAIPLVGIILLLVWAFGSTAKPSKANWAKANLAWAAIAIAFYVIFVVIIIGTFLGTSQSLLE
jgi:hypothetical protein